MEMKIVQSQVMPESFNVLVKELQARSLRVGLNTRDKP